MAFPGEYIGNLNDIDQNQWNLILQKTTANKYVCINQKNNNVCLSTEQQVQQAEALGFKKLTPAQINEITQGKLQNSPFTQHLQASSALLKEKEFSVIADPAQKTELSIIEQKLFTQTQNTASVTTQITELSLEKRVSAQMKDATTVTPSKIGTDGVYFVNGPTLRPLVLKLYCESLRPFEEIIADRFLQKFDFITPKYQLLQKTSEDGNIICQNLVKLLPPDQTLKLEKLNTNIKRKGCEYMTVMEYVPGTSFAQLTDKQFNGVLTNSANLEALGEMIFLDACFDNSDRLKKNDSNADNFFLLGELDLSNYSAMNIEDISNKKSIVLLDHGFGRLKPFPSIKAYIDVLMNKDNQREFEVKEIIRFFVLKFEADKECKITYDPDFVATHIIIGINKAKNAVISKFSKQPALVREIFDFPGEIKTQFNINVWQNKFQQIINHLSDTYSEEKKQ